MGNVLTESNVVHTSSLVSIVGLYVPLVGVEAFVAERIAGNVNRAFTGAHNGVHVAEASIRSHVALKK
jgi:hypothetical protein